MLNTFLDRFKDKQDNSNILVVVLATILVLAYFGLEFGIKKGESEHQPQQIVQNPANLRIKQAEISANNFCNKDATAKQNPTNMQNCITTQLSEYSKAGDNVIGSTSKRLSRLDGNNSAGDSASVAINNNGNNNSGSATPYATTITYSGVATSPAAPTNANTGTPLTTEPFAPQQIDSERFHKDGSTSSRLQGRFFSTINSSDSASSNKPQTTTPTATASNSGSGSTSSTTVTTNGGNTAWNGVCGTTSGSCILGTASTVADGVWSCAGQNGGATASCGTPAPVAAAGVCGTTLGTCSTGTSTYAGTGSLWSCADNNGGSTQLIATQIIIKSGFIIILAGKIINMVQHSSFLGIKLNHIQKENLKLVGILKGLIVLHFNT